MASNKKIAEIVMAIKTIYPYYARDNDSEVLARTWSMLLKPYSDKAVEIAIYKCLQKCKMPPTPADVIEQINAMAETTEQTDEELWSIYTRALHNVSRQMYCFTFTFVERNGLTQGDNARAKVGEIWDGLPERLKRYIGSKSELMRLAKGYTDEELRYEKTRFMKTMPIIKKREEYSELNLLLGDAMLKIEQGG